MNCTHTHTHAHTHTPRQAGLVQCHSEQWLVYMPSVKLAAHAKAGTRSIVVATMMMAAAEAASALGSRGASCENNARINGGRPVCWSGHGAPLWGTDTNLKSLAWNHWSSAGKTWPAN